MPNAKENCYNPAVKICHIITRLILGGAQENTILTCEALRQAGHDVTLITGPALGPEGELLSRAQTGGYRVIVMDELRREISPLRDLAAARRLRAVLGELQPDVVHTHSSKAGILGRNVAWRCRRRGELPAGMKIVHTVHGLPYHRYLSAWKNRLYITLEKRAARQSDAIISVADAMTAQALAAGVGRPEQYTTIYSGMEVENFLSRPAGANEFRASLGLDSRAVLVTQVSRLAELKGHYDIIRAAEAVQNPDVVFCFVGDGHWRAGIARAIASAGLSERFSLTGLLPPEQIPAVMHATDILIHCSLREGLARTLPQAMLAGKPVISYDVDGAREVVSDETGVLLQAGDVGAIAGAIDFLAGDGDRRRLLGAAGRKLCRERFDWRVMGRKIERLYEQLMG